MADRRRLTVLSPLALCFFIRGVVGALGFRHFGDLPTVPLAMLLISPTIVSAFDDVVVLLRRRSGSDLR